jgi:ABC-type lipoprotein export system ATPase subunit
VFAGRTSVASDVWHKEISFHKGETYLIEAASGTGKSSLCGYIYGHRKDYQGIICFDDANIRSLSVSRWVDIRRRSLSLLFQDLRLFPGLTALENILIKNNLTGYKKKNEIIALFEQLDIADKLNTRMDKLSFGQQQRVAFIRSLCQPYDFILLDEPVSHLDDSNGENMARLLAEEANKQGAGVIVTSIGKQIHLNYDNVLKL